MNTNTKLLLGVTIALVALGGCGPSSPDNDESASVPTFNQSQTLSEQTTEEPPSPVYTAAAFSPNSQLVACYAGNVDAPFLEVRNLEGTVIARTPVNKSAVARLSWSSDSQRIVAANWNAQVWKLQRSAKQTRLVPIVTFPGNKPGLAPAPDSSTTSMSSSEPMPVSTALPMGSQTKVLSRNSLTAAPTRASSGEIEGTRVSSLHQLGARLMFQPEGPVYHRIELFNPRTLKVAKQLCKLRYTPRDNDTFSFSPAGPPLGLVRESEDGMSWQLAAWDIKSGRRLWERAFPGMRVYGDWSPDGKYVVISGSDSSHRMAVTPVHHPVEVLDARTGRTVRKIESQTTNWVTSVTRNGIWTYGAEKSGKHSLRFATWDGKNVLTRTSFGVVGIQFPHSVAASPDGQHLIIEDSFDGIQHWSMADLKAGKVKPTQWEEYYDEE
ncbi:WD40 repeat domain-containing protein [bacterium]|nr:MAG: WD40 repeat domain-containing protein [bacterium]